MDRCIGRCQTNKRCRNKKSKLLLPHLELCYIHIKKIYYIFAVKIQKIYRGFKIRKYVKKIRILPNDLQIHIISFIKYERNIEQQNKIIKIYAKVCSSILAMQQ